MTDEMNPKVYLGDSVYVAFDGFHLVLTTENGFGPTNQIFLEPEVYLALTEYVETVRRKQRESVAPTR